VQIAHRAGIRFIATAATSDLAYVREIVADTVVDFRTERFEDTARDVDAVLDLVGGETQNRSFQVLRRGGKLVSAVSKPNQERAKSHGVDATFFLVKVTTGHGWASSCRLARRARPISFWKASVPRPKGKSFSPWKLREEPARGVDAYFDNTSGAIRDAVLRRLAIGARVAICATASLQNWAPWSDGPKCRAPPAGQARACRASWFSTFRRATARR
jgi:NADPH-dependent curcumin reductase CurA